jgi:hypothetical protein
MLKGKAHVGLAAAGIGLVVLVAGLAAWSAHQKRVHREAVSAVIADTTARLRESLAGKPELKKIEASLAAAEASLEALGKTGKRNPDLAAGAELYVINAREIFKRQVLIQEKSQRSAESRNSLQMHMGRAARRDQGWFDEAMARKKKVEAEYFDYNLALSGLTELLWKFPETRKALLPHVQDKLLLEVGPAEDAYRRYQEEAKRVAADLDSVRRIAPR